MDKEEIALKEKLTAFYESTGTLAWNMMTGGNVHFGYWDALHKDIGLAEATTRLTQLMIDKTDISAGQTFCDIGCGVGIPAITLAKEKNCRVNGITIVESQKKAADENARLHGTEAFTRFFAANALKMPFEDNSHDGAWFFESIFHMGHEAVLKETCRILKPSATLLIADVVDLGAMTQKEKQIALEINNSACVTKDQYPDLLKRTGFELMESMDITREVLGCFESKIVEAVNTHKEALSQIADDDFLNNFLFLVREVKRTSGYLIVKAKKINA
ncbi:MAG: methyltransferase domain-containing protein [Proteobacteria bacterium]|nr:methyltransferase domain-containing protein [Pseudomonadota bacterium]